MGFADRLDTECQRGVKRNTQIFGPCTQKNQVTPDGEKDVRGAGLECVGGSSGMGLDM